MTNDLRTLFDEDQSQTGRELLNRLQDMHPAAYPDGLLRTLQRRLKTWRAEVARQLVFGAADGAPGAINPNPKTQPMRPRRTGNIGSCGNTLSHSDCRAARICRRR